MEEKLLCTSQKERRQSGVMEWEIIFLYLTRVRSYKAIPRLVHLGVPHHRKRVTLTVNKALIDLVTPHLPIQALQTPSWEPETSS